MPHVSFVPFTGLRVREREMLEFGMTLPGLRKRAEALQGLPSLGLLTLAGMTPTSWACSYHPSGETKTLVDDVLRARPDVVAVSALTASALEAYEFCEAMRANDIQVVIGGLHATVLPDEAASHATAVCVGDGESSWLKILQDAEAGNLQGIYRPLSPFDLSKSPTPCFDLLTKSSGTKAPQRWTVQTQRGCPWACEFCGASRLLGPARFKPVDLVASELAAVGKLDRTPWIELADDNTFAGRKDSMELLDVIASAGVKYFTESDWRIGEDPKLLAKLAESGCVQVLVGIESLASYYSGMGRKQAEFERMENAICAIQEAGVVVNGCFIVGADGETNESIDEMAKVINDSSLAEIQLTLQTPFPSTGLYRRMKKDQRLLPDRDWSYYTLFDVVFQPDTLTVRELESGFRRIMTSVFSESSAAKRSSIRRQVWRKQPYSRNSR